MDIKEALREELTKLKAEVANDPRFRRITRIEELLADYEQDSPGDFQTVRRIRHAIHRRKSRGEPSKAEKIRREIVAFLGNSRAPRNTIFEHLKAKELMGREKNPLAQLSAYLSSWRDFVAHDDAGNWYVIEARTQPNGAQNESRGIRAPTR